MTTWAEHVAQQQALLDEPMGPTECSCGAPGGSAHDHNTGRVVQTALRDLTRETFTERPDYGCANCRAHNHRACTGKSGGSAHPVPCTCHARHHSPSPAPSATVAEGVAEASSEHTEETA